MDILDNLQQEEFILQQAVNSRTRLTHCIDCEEPIHKERRKLLKGVTLCTECATLKEKRIIMIS